MIKQACYMESEEIPQTLFRLPLSMQNSKTIHANSTDLPYVVRIFRNFTGLRAYGYLLTDFIFTKSLIFLRLIRSFC